MELFKKKNFFFLIMLVVMIFAVAPVNAALADTPQPKFHNDLGNTGQSDYGQNYVGSQTATNKWTPFNTAGVVQGSPVIGSEGKIYITSGNTADTSKSNIYAVNSTTGTQIWHKTLNDNGDEYTPAISDDGTIYVNTDQHVYALNPSNGNTKYTYDLSVNHAGDLFSTSPTIARNGNIIIGGINGWIYALSPSLTEVWRSANNYGTNYGSNPAIGTDNTIYFGATGDATHPTRLVALNPDGTEKWTYGITQAHVVHSSPAIGTDGTIYIGSTQSGSDVVNGKLYAIDPVTHTAKWTFTDPTVTLFGIDSSPAVMSGTVYFGSSGVGTNYFYALDLLGNEKWRFAIPGDSVSAPAIDKNFNVYFAEVGTGAVYAISPTGQEIWRYYSTNTIQYSSPAIGSDGTIYIGGNTQNKLFAIRGIAVPPTVKTIDPANNAVNVPRNKVITITFSAPIKAGNMWIELLNSGGTAIPITKSISGNLLTITPKALLATGTKYNILLHTGSVVDYGGKPLAAVVKSFTTSTDGTAPTVTSSDPTNNAVNIARNKVITIIFSEPIKAGNMWIELLNSGGTAIPITKSISGNLLTITPKALLATGTKYNILLHTGSITDYAGNNIASAVRSFTTSSDATAPTVTTSDPSNNAVNIARNKVIKVTFSEPLRWGNWWIELKNNIGTTIPITMSITNNVLTINHAALLAPGTKYNILLHTGSVTDVAGNPLAAKVITFTTTNT